MLAEMYRLLTGEVSFKGLFVVLCCDTYSDQLGPAAIENIVCVCVIYVEKVAASDCATGHRGDVILLHSGLSE
jgi:hypothetical protein